MDTMKSALHSASPVEILDSVSRVYDSLPEGIRNPWILGGVLVLAFGLAILQFLRGKRRRKKGRLPP